MKASKNGPGDLIKALDLLDSDALDPILSGISDPESDEKTDVRRIKAKTAGLIKNRDRMKLRRGFAAAAAAVLMTAGLSAAVTACAISMDLRKREVANAESFFQEYDISREGLTEDQMLSVYRDIVTGSFSDPLTLATVSRNFPTTNSLSSLKYQWSQRLKGASAGAEFFWNGNYAVSAGNKPEISYLIQKDNPRVALKEISKTQLVKVSDASEIWRIDVPAPVISCSKVRDSAILWLERSYLPTDMTDQRSVAAVDSGGNILWRKALSEENYGPLTGYPIITDNHDGTIGFAYVLDRYCHVFTLELATGKTLNEAAVKTDTDLIRVCSDSTGYALFFRTPAGGPDEKLVVINRNGNVKQEMTVRATEEELSVSDKGAMIAGKIYLSVQKNAVVPCSDAEKDRILAWIMTLINSPIKAPENGPLYFKYVSGPERDKSYQNMSRLSGTQMLLEIDPENRTTRVIHSAPESDGTILDIRVENSGVLVWEVGAVELDDAALKRSLLYGPRAKYDRYLRITEYRFVNGELKEVLYTGKTALLEAK